MTENRGNGIDAANDDTQPAGLDRRRFVGLVGASLAAQWLADSPSSAWSATAAPPTGSSLVPGYLRASHLAAADEAVLRDLCDPRMPFHDTLRRVIPERLPLEFISSNDVGTAPVGFDGGCARIWIHGLLPPGGVRLAAGLDALHLEAEVSPEAGVGPYQHYVWGLDTGPVENLSGATTFDAPVGEGAELRLWTGFEWANRGGGILGSEGGIGDPLTNLSRYSTLLTLEDRRGEPRLRPGVYCLPLSEKAQGAFPLVANRDWLVPDELPYLLLSVQPVG